MFLFVLSLFFLARKPDEETPPTKSLIVAAAAAGVLCSMSGTEGGANIPRILVQYVPWCLLIGKILSMFVGGLLRPALLRRCERGGDSDERHSTEHKSLTQDPGGCVTV
jgi:hypothetical protein